MFDSGRSNTKVIHFQGETQNTTCLLLEDYWYQKGKSLDKETDVNTISITMTTDMFYDSGKTITIR